MSKRAKRTFVGSTKPLRPETTSATPTMNLGLNVPVAVKATRLCPNEEPYVKGLLPIVAAPVMKFMGLAPGVSLRPFKTSWRPPGQAAVEEETRVSVPIVWKLEFCVTVYV